MSRRIRELNDKLVSNVVSEDFGDRDSTLIMAAASEYPTAESDDDDEAET